MLIKLSVIIFLVCICLGALIFLNKPRKKETEMEVMQAMLLLRLHKINEKFAKLNMY
jgi:hypothetical protein